jgi:hypothetical protein
VEPFNEWFKSLFELDDRVWHRGLENNQTQLLAVCCLSRNWKILVFGLA